MRHILLTSIILFASAAAFAQGARSPQGTPSPSLPHDQHMGLTVSADAYTDAARTKEKLGKANPMPAGILPVEVFLRNDTDQPMQIDLSTVKLDVMLQRGGRQDVDSLTSMQVAQIIEHPTGSNAPRSSPLPRIGLSGGDSKVDKLAAEIRKFALDADIIPPMGSIHGFLFFNVDHDISIVSRSNLYIPDVMAVSTKKPLIFFEVPLGEAPQP